MSAGGKMKTFSQWTRKSLRATLYVKQAYNKVYGDNITNLFRSFQF